VWVGLVSQWSRADLGLEVMEPCRSRPEGGGAVPISAWRSGSRPGGGGAVLDLGFFFLFNSLVLKLWNLTLFGC
jgi:hypothetical protein